MRRLSWLIGLLMVAGVLVGAAPASASTACLSDVQVGSPDIPGTGDVLPVMTTADLPVFFTIFYEQLSECPDVSVTVSRPDGSDSHVVPLSTEQTPGGADEPGSISGSMTLPLATGAGLWLASKVTSGADSKALDHTFRIYRGTEVTLDPVPTVAAPARQTVTGRVRHYDGTGSLVPTPGRRVDIHTWPGNTLLASPTTGADGRFATTTGLRSNNQIEAYVGDDPTANTAAGGSATVPVVVNAVLLSATAKSTGHVNEFWRVDGRGQPGGLMTQVFLWDGSRWEASGSFGPAAADGTFTRWWKPTATGSYRVRVVITGSGNGNLPLYREFTVNVTSLQTVPTYLDGTVRPTAGPPIHQHSTMSAFGHLRVRHSNGTIGPFAGKYVHIEERPITTPASQWYDVAGATTSSTGYFYANWNVLAQSNFEVRVRYASPYVTVKSATKGFGPFTLLP